MTANVEVWVQGVLFGVGLFMALMGTMFWTKSIGPNMLTGVRVRWTLADPEIWYLANRRCAPWLLALAVLFLIAGVSRAFLFSPLFAALAGLGAILTCEPVFYAKKLYLKKYGTADAVRRGWFRWSPPA